ncbi:YIP1 family protein [Staphylococcus pettenkoferi]|uniref:YIP1 family protein n=1 Tax=Staphylococcus pettenkoferi TaxID=170573 RepID=A0A9Q4H5G5_9STAP|nr:YIP1 family protein [Staphylococcus pettenkoferi]MCY1568652.1 YIP1 family protein [Staphylococcus pettenkoferi]MCY1576203.1 YIP1 family protein [Staphylococcus pettenkoferi]MCY1595676.1 YIP1 family protein [Staphylococcus pettenkoferi]MCY1619079.1 YIP1 family protein [Staphylococcus pettenkoferi]
MENSKLPFADHFAKLREHPKWLVKLIAFLIISFFVTWLGSIATDQTKMLKKSGADQQAIDTYNQFHWPMIIGVTIGNFIWLTLIAFLIFLVISKIMKSDVPALSIFSASLSYNIIVYTFVLIVNAIQAIAGIDMGEYNISSLNIFDKGNGFLGAIKLQHFLAAYVIGLYYYFTAKLSKKSAVIWAIVALIVLIAIGMMNAG